VDVLNEMNELIGRLIEITEREQGHAVARIGRASLADDRDGIEEAALDLAQWKRTGDGYRHLLRPTSASPLRRLK